MKKIPIEERFWCKVDMSGGDDACWEWQAARDHKGYGWIAIDRKMRRAHTIAYRLAKGEPPNGHIVRHTCDNPPCCNPSHLLNGTRKDNGHDASVRNRFNDRKGSLNPRSKLSEEDVSNCRSRYKPWDKHNGIRALSIEYGINEETMREAVHGKTWKHVA